MIAEFRKLLKRGNALPAFERLAGHVDSGQLEDALVSVSLAYATYDQQRSSSQRFRALSHDFDSHVGFDRKEFKTVIRR